MRPAGEDFEFGKDHFGLGHSQVRPHTSLIRHIVLTLAALAVCAITAAQARQSPGKAPLVRLWARNSWTASPFITFSGTPPVPVRTTTEADPLPADGPVWSLFGRPAGGRCAD